MKSSSNANIAFFVPRLAIALVLAFTGILLAVASFGASSNGTAMTASDSAATPQWSIVSSPDNPAWPDNILRAITCASSTECWAVGESRDFAAESSGPLRSEALIERWDGKSWSIVPSAKLDGDFAFLYGVSCASVADCWAVGQWGKALQGLNTLIEHWDGKSWSLVPSPNANSVNVDSIDGPPIDFLFSVTCTSASNCWAVGGYWYTYIDLGDAIAGITTGIFLSLIEHWDGSSWTIASSPNANQKNLLLDVTCTSASDCYAAGYSEANNAVGLLSTIIISRDIKEPLVQHWDGSTWNLVPSVPHLEPIGGGKVGAWYRGIACVSATECWAAGDFMNTYATTSLTGYFTLTDLWNGQTWSTVSSPNPAQRINYLNAVACASASECWVVGDYNPEDPAADNDPSFLAWPTLTERWDGTAWKIVPSPNVSTASIHELFGVACAGASDCWTVGYYGIYRGNGQGNYHHTLIEHYGVPQTVTPPPVTPAPPQLLNISTRLQVQGGDNALIGGFIVTGTTPKKVIVRAIGPSLPVGGALADPVLELHAPDGSVVTNDNWKINDQTQQSQEAEVSATGVPPSNDLESAIVATLAPGAYTAVVKGKNGATGIGLVEAFDLDQAAASKLANISTRGFVDTGDNAMIGGFIVSSNLPTSNVVVRAIGPSLTAAGVSNALANPTLELHDQNGAVFASNDDWQQDARATEIQSDHLAPGDPRESATLQTLAPGNYTAIVRGVNNTTGVGLVEVYNVQ